MSTAVLVNLAASVAMPVGQDLVGHGHVRSVTPLLQCCKAQLGQPSTYRICFIYISVSDLHSSETNPDQALEKSFLKGIEQHY